MGQNTFKVLAKLYKDQVEESDKAGYAEIFKTCTKLFFEGLNSGHKPGVPTVHFEDVEFRDGYFTFGFGTNSVVHFHVKECPGWLFGIWWKTPKEPEAERDTITGTLFAQFEETIDKFKPSCSEYVSDITVFTKGRNSYWSLIFAWLMIAFIRDEPYLAFCREYLCWDYNYEYHTREEAREEYEKYREWKNNSDRYTKECDEKVLAFIGDRVLPLFTDAELYDNGEGWSPRYDVIAPFEKNKDVVDEPGAFSFFDEDNAEEKKIADEYHALIKECEDLSRKYEFCWYSPCQSSVTFYEQKPESVTDC